MDWQAAVVAVAVLAAALYATWALWPARSRRSVLARLDERLAGDGAGRVAATLRRRLVAPLLVRASRARGCGGCETATGPPGQRRAPP